MFESSVNSDGTQTISIMDIVRHWFESSVNSDGTQTNEQITACIDSV